MRDEKEQRILNDFGERFAWKRKEVGITQEELSARSGITLSQIARIETGKINTTICTVYKLAEAMGVDPKELF